MHMKSSYYISKLGTFPFQDSNNNVRGGVCQPALMTPLHLHHLHTVSNKIFCCGRHFLKWKSGHKSWQTPSHCYWSLETKKYPKLCIGKCGRGGGVEYRIQQECTPNVSTERNRLINNNYVNNCFDQHFLLGPVEIRVIFTPRARSHKSKTREFYSLLTSKLVSIFNP